MRIVISIAVALTGLFIPALAVSAPCCTPDATAKIAAQAGFLDVAGIRLGMPGDKVPAAMKAVNPSLALSVIRTENWDFAARLTTGSSHDPAKQWVQTVAGHVQGRDGSGEQLRVHLALPPNPQVVLKIDRILTFAPAARPNVDNLIADLRKKYGHESLGPDTRTQSVMFNMMGNRKLIWFFDPSGRLATESEPISQKMLKGSTCEPGAAYVPDFGRFANPHPSARGIQHKGFDACHEHVAMTVELLCTDAGGTSCGSMSLAVWHLPLWKNAEAATDAWIDQQRRAVLERDKRQSQQVGGPKL